MALIICPECGRELSDKAKNCPHCGFPINEVLPKTQENTSNDINPSKPPKEKKKMPSWLLALIIVVVLILIGNIVVYCFNDKISGSDAVQGEEVAQITYPNITERGVEPFLLGTSMFNIPAKGAFYDTILLEKLYSAFAYSKLFEDMTESQLQDLKKEWGDEVEVLGSVGIAKVIKESDTIMIIHISDDGVIKNIEVLSNKFQLVNGVHVGLSSTEMFNTYKACYISPGLGSFDHFGIGKQQFHYTDLPHDIYIMASASKHPGYLESKGTEVTVKDVFYFSIPFEEVKNDSVRSIIIDKNMVISSLVE